MSELSGDKRFLTMSHKLFWYNTRSWRTDGRTDRQQISRLCVA